MAAPVLEKDDVPWIIWQRICVWFLFKMGKTCPQILVDLQTVFGASAVKKSCVAKLLQEFRQGQLRMNDKHRSGRPKSCRTQQNIDRVSACVRANRRTGLYNLCEDTGLSYGTVQRIVRRDLHLKKRAAKMIPHALTPVQMCTRVGLCQLFLRNAKQPGWLNRVITADESWFYVENPHPKSACREWLQPGEDHPHVAPRTRSAKKAMLVVFFDRKGLVYRHWVLHGTINSDLYIYLLRQLRLAIQNRRRSTWLRRRNQPYLLHDDNASPHKSVPTLQFEQRTGIERVPHPPYSPDLAPCDFFLFPYLKKQLRGRQFQDLLTLTEAVDQIIGSIPSATWSKVYTDWVARAHKSVTFGGWYFEGMKVP